MIVCVCVSFFLNGSCQKLGIAMWRDLNFVLIVVLNPGGRVVVLKPVSYYNTTTEVAAG